MRRVLLLGAGKIGRMIAGMLGGSGSYEVTVADADPQALERVRAQSPVETLALDAGQPEALAAAMRGRDAVISALSYQFNVAVAEAALAADVSYFDLTEDLETMRAIRRLAVDARPGQVFIPQCGLAPGFVSFAAHHLTRSFELLDTVAMRVGALPQFPTNMLKYNLTWSTDGLINEYCNPCETIHEGKPTIAEPLEGWEQFSLDGVHYEAFNTSGGAGTLAETLAGRVRQLDYKTVRYRGHRDLVRFLIAELRLGERRGLLKEILERAVPITLQDVVVIFCHVTGWRKGQLVQHSDARKIYGHSIDGEPWSAIQITTAASLAAVVDLQSQGRLPERGFVRQEQIDFDEFLANRFGQHYQTPGVTKFITGASDALSVIHAD